MNSKKTISKKVILVGSFCVGKTSLVSSFVYKKFEEIYQTTLGVRIDKKLIDLNAVNINMLIWDIGGEIDNTKIPKSYYLGASGIIYILDLTRDYEKAQLENDLNFLRTELPHAPILTIGNKADLIDKNDLEKVIEQKHITVDFVSSAKTGENVETVFKTLANKMI